MSPPDAMVSLLAGESPALTAAEAERLVADRYDLRGRARLLTSERDQNFHFAADGREYVLKISNAAEEAAVVDFQNAALDHIARADPRLPVPRVIRTREGAQVTRAGDHLMRLMSWLPGTVMCEVERTTGLRRSLGALHARLGLALRGFEHARSSHELLWDLKHAGRLGDLLPHVEDPRRRALAEQGLRQFRERAEPKLAALRAQVIHNDLNPYNVVVSPTDAAIVTGVLDFGDMVRAPLICDVAIAASYHVTAGELPLAGVEEFVTAYDSVSPLLPEEWSILVDLIVARLTMTVLITGWRAAEHPHNRDYILRNASSAWTNLETLLKTDMRLESTT